MRSHILLPQVFQLVDKAAEDKVTYYRKEDKGNGNFVYLKHKEECKDAEVIETEEEEVKTEAGISEPENDELEKEEDKDESEELEKVDEDDEDDDVIEEKSLDKKVHDILVKQLNSKSVMSKLDTFRKESSKASKKLEEKSNDGIKRDSYGRNLDYI